MSTILSSILRRAVRQDGSPLNILTFPTHERYETGLARTGHQFYAFRGPGIKDWNGGYAPVPPNYTLLDPERGDGQLPPEVVFDLVLSQNRLGEPSQFRIAASLARSLSLPHVNLEHCLPHPSWGRGNILRVRQEKADVEVFIGEFSRDAWGVDGAAVIEHGIDTDLFRPSPDVSRKPMLLSVVNDWINRNWCCGFNFWRDATRGLPCFVVGDTPGLSKPAASTDELLWRYQNADIFVNTSLISPVPTVLLEAMACGCAVVSTDTCMIPDIIEHGVNGLLAAKPDVMRTFCEHLLEDHEECRRLGEAARQTIIDRFNIDRFMRDWNGVFDAATASTNATASTKEAAPPGPEAP